MTKVIGRECAAVVQGATQLSRKRLEAGGGRANGAGKWQGNMDQQRARANTSLEEQWQAVHEASLTTLRQAVSRSHGSALEPAFLATLPSQALSGLRQVPTSTSSSSSSS